MDTAAYKRIFAFPPDEHGFNRLALEVFRYQYAQNAVYHDFVAGMNINPEEVACIEQIPFLPIGLFKTHRVVSGDFQPELTFESSGTTSTLNSMHYVADADMYRLSFSQGMEYFYGSLSGYTVFALLPSYLERKNSSLVYMMEQVLFRAHREMGGFYLYEQQKLRDELLAAHNKGLKIMLVGVTFALLDMARDFPVPIPNAILVETGGMKGRGEEMLREQLHQTLCHAFGVDAVHSEYGMTELLSQAWSSGNGLFRCPPWMRVIIGDTNDPLGWMHEGRTGSIRVIDLANLHSCSFIATQDLGRAHADGTFEVLGRFDYSDLRGCSLLTA